ncbi:MAG: hypothetical protein ACRYGI_20175 [Janthinobacterium lividum]
MTPVAMAAGVSSVQPCINGTVVGTIDYLSGSVEKSGSSSDAGGGEGSPGRRAGEPSIAVSPGTIGMGSSGSMSMIGMPPVGSDGIAGIVYSP